MKLELERRGRSRPASSKQQPGLKQAPADIGKVASTPSCRKAETAMPDPPGGMEPVPADSSGGSSPADIETRLARAQTPIPPTSGDWVLLASYNELLLDQEFKLQNNRITWMMASESVLFATFCLILPAKGTTPAETVVTLLHWIPVMAIFIVVGAFSGVVAAQCVIYELEHERSVYQTALSRYFRVSLPDVGSRREGRLRYTRVFGFSPVIVIMLMLFALWLVLLFNISMRMF
jgi:hypothetical protein